MKSLSGGVLPIVMIMLSAFILLAYLMGLLNKQYQSETEVIDEFVMLRQDLLTFAKNLLIDIENRSHDEGKLIQWSGCESQDVPKIAVDPYNDISYQYAKLDEECGYGREAYRIWLSQNNYNALLVVDVLIQDQEEWHEKIIRENERVELVFDDDVWKIKVDHNHQTKELIIFNDEIRERRSLRYQRIRKNKASYEIVLVFDNKDQNALELFRIVVCDYDLVLNQIDEILVGFVPKESSVEIISHTVHEQKLKNWKLVLSDREVRGLVLYDQVIFMAFEMQNEVGIIALTLAGQLFFNDGLLGFQKHFKKDAKEDYVLFECAKRDPLMIDVWQMGCFNQKVVRYFFVE